MDKGNNVPEQILSIKPENTSPGIQTEAYIVVKTLRHGGLIASRRKPQDIVRLPVSIPGHTSLKDVASERSFNPILGVKGTQPGTYKIDGFVVTYRWGPLLYRTRLFYSPEGMFTYKVN